MKEVKYRLDLTHNFLKIDASKEFYLRPNDDDAQRVFMLPQSYTINCRKLLLRETSLTPQWFLDLIFLASDDDTRTDDLIIADFFKFSSYDVSLDADNVSVSGQTVFVEGVNGDNPWFSGVLTAVSSISESAEKLLDANQFPGMFNLSSVISSLVTQTYKLRGQEGGSDGDDFHSIRGVLDSFLFKFERWNHVGRVNDWSALSPYVTRVRQYPGNAFYVYYGSGQRWTITSGGLAEEFCCSRDCFVSGTLIGTQIDSSVTGGLITVRTKDFILFDNGYVIAFSDSGGAGIRPRIVVNSDFESSVDVRQFIGYATILSSASLYL